MKALSFTQPWASLVAIGAKQIETRSWNTTHRGLIAIHAARDFKPDAQELCATEPFRSTLLEARAKLPNFHQNPKTGQVSGLPLGAVVAVGVLAEVRRMVEGYAGVLKMETLDPRSGIVNYRDLPDGPEREFGYYAAGRYAFVLRDVAMLREPIPARGALGLWDWYPPAHLHELLVKDYGQSTPSL